nr:MAG TPA: hypothetical protein [Bacteriophage sp.]
MWSSQTRIMRGCSFFIHLMRRPDEANNSYKRK